LAPSVIELEEAVKDYGNNRKIGPANLSVEKGEIVGFLGPNGSGKTTCIRLILGLIKPTSGFVKVNGFDPIMNHVEALRKVAYSPELPNVQTFLNPNEFLDLICHEIDFPPGINQSDEIKRVLELVGLSEYAKTKVGKLSKGMVQRLSVAQALIGSPETLILDEPMIGLDPAGVAHFRDVFRDFASGGKGTVLMSSHIMGEVESLCTSVAIIHHGKILFKGPAEEVEQKVLDYSLIRVETSPLAAQTIKELSQIHGIENIEVINESTSANVMAIEIRVGEKGLDLRAEVSEFIVKSGAKLFTIKQAENMLERAYLKALKDKGDGRP